MTTSGDFDDPRLTAYALGELPSDEARQFETLLATWPEGRREVEAIRSAADWLGRQLAAEPCPALSAAQRQAIVEGAAPLAAPVELASSAAPPAKRRRRWGRRLGVAAGLGLAACVLAVVFLPSLYVVHEAGRYPHRELAGLERGAPLPADAGAAYVVGKPAQLRRGATHQPASGEAAQHLVRALPAQSSPAAPAQGARPLPLYGKEHGIYREFFDIDADGLSGLESVSGLESLPYLPARIVAGVELRLCDENGVHNTEAYDAIVENPFLEVLENPLSTFSIDVDTASYANVRRFLSGGRLPPPGAVRIEELVNYFPYEYAGPAGDAPFAVHALVVECPWNSGHRLLRVALKGREIPPDQRPPNNLVFLLDVSGSMQDPQKLPLVKAGMRLLVEQLRPSDRVAIAVYAGASGLVLPSTSGDQKQTILAAIERLEAGGSTNGAAGIELAYETAAANRIKDGTNRVILCTDGDFNVGLTDQSQLVALVERQAKTGVFLSVLGFGMGNYKDSTLEKLADKGNGNYGYVDGLREARKLLVDQLSATLVTIAKDVKLQLEFNPARVAAYRLLGYENRLLAKEDFRDDTKDAGEVGAGHTVTALYELVPAGQEAPARPVPALEYQRPSEITDEARHSPNLLTIKLRYKLPEEELSRDELRLTVSDAGLAFGQADGELQFAAAVAAFGMLLRGSAYAGTASYESVAEIAASALGEDRDGYRREFVELVERARLLRPAESEPRQPQGAPGVEQPGRAR